MRKISAAAAAAALALAACEKEPDTLVADPATVNEAADQAAEMNRPSYTPVEFGNGDEGNGAAGNEAATNAVGP